MTYLIIGSKGQLGTELSKLLPQALTADYTELDMTDAAAVKSYVSAHAVDVIINCAAYTAVDKAEDEPEKAAAVNADGVANLAASGAAVIHISTDYVFDGSGHRPYTPQDTPRPISVYGRTKLAGEQALMETAETAIIIRTAWLYSPHGNNFVKTMLRLGSERKDINVVCDQIGSPTSAADLAAAICTILPRLKKGMKGIYHYTNEGVCSWYDFAVEIMALGKRNCNVHPILSSQYPTKAARPFYSVLDKTAIRNDFGITIPHWKESLSTCIQEPVKPKYRMGIFLVLFYLLLIALFHNVYILPETMSFSCDIDTQKAINLQVFYAESNHNFTEGTSVRHQIQQGKTHVELKLPIQSIARLRIDIGRFPQTVRLSNIKLTTESSALDLSDYSGLTYTNIESHKVREDGSLEIFANHADPYISYRQFTDFKTGWHFSFINFLCVLTVALLAYPWKLLLPHKPRR